MIFFLKELKLLCKPAGERVNNTYFKFNTAKNFTANIHYDDQHDSSGNYCYHATNHKDMNMLITWLFILYSIKACIVLIIHILYLVRIISYSHHKFCFVTEHRLPIFI